jgi:CubicO group peptidase (beta-lactamase class C family)
MRKRTLGGIVGGLLLALSVPGVGVADDPPNEGEILLQEIPGIAARTTLYSLPPDPESALEALATLPDGAQDVIAMHLGRINPNPNESTPGVAPLTALLGARVDLLLNQQHWQKKLADTSNGEFAILLLPMDATTVIVIMPTQVVKADPNATPLPERRVDLSGVTYEFHGDTRTVEQYMADGATNAIAFMHDGEFVYDAYQNGFNPQTRHQMWSVTKSVTTALVGIAVGEGLVDIHQPIESYIDEAAGTAWEGTSVEDLLQMESGIYWVDVPVHQPEELILMGLDFHTNGLYGMTRDDYLLKLTRVSPHGEHYRYNSADAQMLTWLLENVYEDSYSSILSEKLWKPAGMESDALIMVDRLGHAFASMGLFATPRDMVRFGELFRNGGRNLAGAQVVPEAWVEASHNYDTSTGGGPRGYMWPEFSEGYTASGYGHQRVSVGPALKMSGVRFGNDPVDTVAPAEWEAVYRAVGEALAGQ